MSQPPLLAVVVVGFTVVLAVLVGLVARSRRDVRRAEDQATEIRSLSQKLFRLQQEQDFILQFIRELPHLTGELNVPMKLRRIPEVLLGIVVRTFRPVQAVVLVRRRPTSDNPERSEQLIAAAVAVPGPRIRQGMVIGLGKGEIGRVAEAERVLDRKELDREAVEEVDGGDDGLASMKVDLGAPMLVGEEVLGAIVLSSPHRQHSQDQDVLWLVAQIGAFALRNFTELAQVRSVADLDALTGIYNKGVLTYRLGEAVFEAERNGGRVSVFLFDIDHFKNYNDINGHLAGDELLRRLSRLASEHIRSDDVFGRFGGEEFLLILSDRDARQALVVAEKLRRLIESHAFPFGDKQPLERISISGGVACFPDDAQSSTELLRVADLALYRAKRGGRNRVETYELEEAPRQVSAGD